MSNAINDSEDNYIWYDIHVPSDNDIDDTDKDSNDPFNDIDELEFFSNNC